MSYNPCRYRQLVECLQVEEPQGESAQQSWLLDWGRRSALIHALSVRF